MTDEPFGRQPKPLKIKIEGGDQIDRDNMEWKLIRFLERAGDTCIMYREQSITNLHYYPRAVND